MKKCIGCQQVLKKEMFRIMSRNSDGLTAFCKICKPSKRVKNIIHEISKVNGEKWLAVVGYEGIYEISNLGRVKSLERMVSTFGGGTYIQNERLLTPFVKKSNRYYAVGLQLNKKAVSIEIHRLLAKAFIPNPLNLSDVNHINNIRTDNRLCNLEWVSRRENKSHGSLFKKSSSKYIGVYYHANKKSKHYSSHYFFDKKLIHLGYFDTEEEAANQYNEALLKAGISNMYNNNV